MLFNSITIFVLLSTALRTFAADIPVIGVYSHVNAIMAYENIGNFYTAGGYVKWLEMAGARAIPIHPMASEEEVEEIFHQINGLVFPGAGNGTDTRVAEQLWGLANEANENGDHFPIWGACLGIQYFMAFASGKDQTDVNDCCYEAEGISLPLNFTDYGIHESYMFHGEEYQEMLKQPITYNHHAQGISPERFYREPGITDMFEITSLSYGTDERAFVSSVEARDFETYPYMAVQWHPEKNAFEYGRFTNTDIMKQPEVVHSKDASQISYETATRFVQEARKSKHVYTEFERMPIVWNYPTYVTDYFETVFIIDAALVLMQIKPKHPVLRGNNA